MYYMELVAGSIADLEAQQDRANRIAKAKGEVIECHQRLKIGANAPCPCGSGRKWKACCQQDSEFTQVAFFPNNHDFWPKRMDPALLLAVAAGVSAWAKKEGL